VVINGLPWVTLKGLRHTHATLLLELGEHPKVVQERLGHSTITTTMNIYSHVTPTMQKAAVIGGEWGIRTVQFPGSRTSVEARSAP